MLVTGCHDTSQLNSAEFYDPSTETWTTIENMNNVHTSFVLTNGTVLAIGAFYNGITLNSAELYQSVETK